MTEHFITSLYETLIHNKYTDEDLRLLDAILEKHRGVIESYKTYQTFKERFPKIKLMIDLKTADQIIEMYYPRIREKIFDLLTKADLREGLINYDSDTGRIQLKDAELMRCFEIEGIDIVDSKIQGNVINCDLFGCQLVNTSVFYSNLFGSTDVKESKIEDSYVSKNVICVDSYVYGKRGGFSGEMEGGIFRQGRATKIARFSKDTEVIEIEKIKF